MLSSGRTTGSYHSFTFLDVNLVANYDLLISVLKSLNNNTSTYEGEAFWIHGTGLN